MSFWGGSSAPAPDPNIGISQKQISDLATDQWNTFKTDIYPKLLTEMDKQSSRADEVWKMDKSIAEYNLEQAKSATERYEEGAIPAMKALKKDADLYNTAGYQEQLAGQAVGDIAAAEEVARQTQVNRDRSYGIDPTSGRSGLGFNANNVTAALAKATAATQTREAAKQLGLQKQANVYNMYAGLPAQANMQTNTAMNAATQGMDSTGKALAGTTTVSGALNNATQTAMGGWNQVGTLGVNKYQADLAKYKADSDASAGIGGLFGTLGAAAIKNPSGAASLFAMSDIRTKENIKHLGMLDNGFPVYAFEYKPEFKDEWGYGIRIGVMAHEVEAKLPSAVIKLPNGYKAVDYNKVINHGI